MVKIGAIVPYLLSVGYVIFIYNVIAVILSFIYY